MSASSARLPENEVGGHPQTGEGAVRKPDIPEDVVAGDPALLAALDAVVTPPLDVPEPDPVDVEPDPIPDPIPAPPDPAPLIPPVTPADSQE